MATRSEHGFTVVELLVSVTIFSLISFIVFDVMSWAGDSQSRIAAMGQSSEQLDAAFAQLDSEIRYAADINSPGASGGSYWVEFESDWTTASTGTQRCSQLQYTPAGVLEQRSWNLPGAAPPLPGATWQVLAVGLARAPVSNPFVLTTNAIPNTPWQLTFNLTSSAGGGTTAVASQSLFTLTALDITAASVSQNVCGGTP